MNMELLRKHIKQYAEHLKQNPDEFKKDSESRKEHFDFYQSWTADKIRNMNEEEFSKYISKLWAMLIWGNKQYVVDKLISDNGFDNLKIALADLVWGKAPVDQRWESVRKNIKGFGPAMISEILSKVYPHECMLWNRPAYVALNYLGFQKLPKYNYQLTGKVYTKLSNDCKVIAKELEKAGFNDADLMTVDYFFWAELQVEKNLSQIFKKKNEVVPEVEKIDQETSQFIHDEVKEKLSNIGKWLGFNSQTEKKVADGSVVDTVWESTIGNMGRVIYVFEVQTKGSIDSLILNLLKSLNNPAVQGVVAVSNKAQLEKIRKHAENVGNLGAKLKYWNYEEVLEIHDALEMVNASINSLGLVPQGF